MKYFRLRGDSLRAAFKALSESTPQWHAAFVASAFLVGMCLSRSQAETATPAAHFVDSVGVNIHLHYNDTAYGDFEKVERALVDLGVHHVRDGLVDTEWKPYYDHLKVLGKDGIHALLIAAPGQNTELLTHFPRHIPGVMEGIEAPNELDQTHADWLDKLGATLTAIGPAARTWNLRVVGPSLTREQSFAEIKSLSPAFDFGNLHNYPAGRNPGTPGWGDNGYGSFAWTLRLAHQAWGTKPMITTETGYVMDSSKPQGIPESIAARYIIRLLLEQYSRGIVRTYIYELVDTRSPGHQSDEDSFGLCRSDFTPKPAYRAVQALLRLLAEPQTPTHRLTPDLTFQLIGASPDIHRVLLQKNDGDFYLMLWVEAPAFDVDRKRELPVAAQHIKLQLSNLWQVDELHFGDDGRLREMGWLSEQSRPAGLASLQLDDRVTVLHITNTKTTEMRNKSRAKPGLASPNR